MADTSVQTPNVVEETDLYLSSDALKKLIALFLDEIGDNIPAIANVIPMTVEEANSAENKDKIPTLLAVFNALSQIDHIKFRLMKGAAGQSFEDYMSDKTPEELALYLYRTADVPNFDLWIYDASASGYARVGKDSVEASDLDLTKYWSKEELDLTAYWSKEELKVEDLVGNIDLTQYVKTTDLEDYVKKTDIGSMTAEDVEQIWNEVKATATV